MLALQRNLSVPPWRARQFTRIGLRRPSSGRCTTARASQPAGLARAMSDLSSDRSILLSATRASVAQRRLALTVSVLLLVMLIATIPFARVTWNTLPVIVPIMKTLMLVADLITAVLL